MVIHYKPKPTHQQPFTPFAHTVWLILLPRKVIDLLLSNPFPPERCRRALISQILVLASVQFGLAPVCLSLGERVQLLSFHTAWPEEMDLELAQPLS